MTSPTLTHGTATEPMVQLWKQMLLFAAAARRKSLL